MNQPRRHTFVISLAGAALLAGFCLGQRFKVPTNESNVSAPGPAGSLPAMAAPPDEVRRLRDQVAVLEEKLAATRDALPAAPVSVPPEPSKTIALVTGMHSIESMANVGRETARAALETRTWAGNVGDTSQLIETMVFPPATREKASELFTRMSAETQARYGNADELLAAAFAGVSTGPQLVGSQVLSEKVGARIEGMDPNLLTDPAYATLRVQNQYSDGTVREMDAVFQHGPDGWRAVIQPNTIVKAAALLGKRSPAPK